jgi:hypothetical protein
MPFGRSLVIERTHDTSTPTIQNMGIDHRGFDIGMTQKFLHRADVVAILEQMRCEGMAEGVTTDALGNVAGPNCLIEGFLDTTGM